MAHALLSFLSLFLLPTLISSISLCGEPCRNLDDCSGQLICISGKCNDDPTMGTHNCSSDSPSAGGCKPSGIVSCQGQNFSTYSCSPPITSSTHARLTNNDFSKGGNGGGPSECDGSYHANTEHIIALSTGWYAGGTLCEKLIYIIADNGRSTTAKVVDECDSRNACDAEHGYQGPCAFDVINASNAVWDALGLSTDLNVVNVTWSMMGSEDLFYFSCL